MSSERGVPHLTLLERLDLALASVFAARGATGVPVGEVEPSELDRLRPQPQMDAAWIAGVLGLRGFSVRRVDAVEILDGSSSRTDQEAKLVRGLASVLAAIRAHAARGCAPDGWFGVELFRELTAGIPRFRRNSIRKDLPWDGLARVRYPDSDDLPGLLEGFGEAHHYGEEAAAFAALHPVRRSIRVLWRFARIAPFPDLNFILAFVLMNAYLLAKGYPMVAPEPADRALLARVVAGPPPPRLVRFEARLVAAAEG